MDNYEEDLNAFLDEAEKTDAVEETEDVQEEQPTKPVKRGKAKTVKKEEDFLDPVMDDEPAPAVAPQKKNDGRYMPPPSHATRKGSFRLPSGIVVTNY